MSYKLGMDAKLYYNTGSFGTPTWTEISSVGDLTVPMTADEAEIARRGQTFKEYLVGQLDVGVEFSMPYDGDDAAWEAIRAAFFGRTTLDVLALDGAVGTDDSQGLRMVCVVSGFPKDEPLTEGHAYQVVLKPTPNSDDAPGWWKVVTGTLTKQ